MSVDNVKHLMDGAAFPLPAIPTRVMMAILEEIEGAWKRLGSRPGNPLTTGNEDTLTLYLETELNRASLRWKSIVLHVVRGAEVCRFDGMTIRKQPDLSLVLTSRGRKAFPLRVECKLLDRATSKTIRLYCDNGVRRFVQGDYAWEAQESIMLGYVRDGSTIPERLGPHLAQEQTTEEDPNRTLSLPSPMGAAYRSRHDRDFVYLEPPGGAPGPITIWHLWLPNSSAEMRAGIQPTGS